jgi:CheY-like chemotaxis protein
MNPALRILVVEDEESDYELLELALRKSKPGCSIHWAHDGADAKRYVAGEGAFADRAKFPFPNLVITDLKMPHMTGFELLSWIKRDDGSWKRLPVIVMSSSSQRIDIEQAYGLGASAYFVKPTNFATLVELCDRILAYWISAQLMSSG